MTNAAHVAKSGPIAKPVHQVNGVEAFAIEQAVGKAQSHRAVICPRASGEVKWTATNHVGKWFESAARAEFNRCTYRITAS
jgi:hypothetical protein